MAFRRSASIASTMGDLHTFAQQSTSTSVMRQPTGLR